MKRWISGVCAAVLCLGGARGVCAKVADYVPPTEHEISQPSGETFEVVGNLPYEVGTIVTAGNNSSTYPKSYHIYLHEDGYWYYREYDHIVITNPYDPSFRVIVKTSEEFERCKDEYKTDDNHLYNWEYVLAANSKFMIDPLPDRVFDTLNFEANTDPFRMRETDQEEKDAMAAAIEAERERLGKNVTSVISDPGPEMFIYEPVETEAAGEHIAAETAPPQTNVQTEEISSASSQPASSQPTETVEDTSAAAPVIAEPPEDTGGGIIWILLLCGGAAIAAGVVIILLLQKRKKQTHIEADK